MRLRKQGTCDKCSKPLYGDDYGAAGHKCEAFEGEIYFVAWHPKTGLVDYQLNPNPDITLQVYCVFRNQRYCEDANHVRTGSQFVKGKNRRGYRIRPVRLVFMDEEGGEQ